MLKQHEFEHCTNCGIQCIVGFIMRVSERVKGESIQTYHY